LWFPSTFSIELANAFEQPVRGRIQVHRQLRYLLTQFLDGKHGHNYTPVQVGRQCEFAVKQALFCAFSASYRVVAGEEE
jgi:hypothetical protein